jgi:erythronate-4-phosphate dehydrogenase
MKIVCAASVLQARPAFAALGEVAILPDRAIRREDLMDAGALIVRSKTRVGRELLEGTPVGFVATATAGTDHLDTAWLDRAGIAWTASPGCNANSVAEYAVTAMALLAAHAGEPLPGKTLGVVGCGQVGGRVAAKAGLLGMRVLRNDPPRAARRPPGDTEEYLPLDAILPQAGILSFHVPLTDTPPFPTRHLAGCRLLGRLKPGAWLLNTSRGAVADTDALQLALASHCLAGCVLDVWENEPSGLPEPLERAALHLTPHIAGYSFEGLLNGTLHCRRELAHYLEADSAWTPDASQLPPPPPPIRMDGRGRSPSELLAAVLAAACPIPADSAAWRAQARTATGPDDLRARFDAFRKGYTARREFAAHRLLLEGFPEELVDLLGALGFQVHA